MYPADLPTGDEIVAVMRKIPADRHGIRLCALIVVLGRGGLRIQEALSLIESYLDQRRGAILVRAGTANDRREVGMDSWAWSDHLAPWLAWRAELPVGALFCVTDGAHARARVVGDRRTWGAAPIHTRRGCSGADSRPTAEAFARFELAGEPLPVIQRQLAHSYVSTTSVYLQGTDVEEIIGTIRSRRADDARRRRPRALNPTGRLGWRKAAALTESGSPPGSPRRGNDQTSTAS